MLSHLSHRIQLLAKSNTSPVVAAQCDACLDLHRIRDAAMALQTPWCGGIAACPRLSCQECWTKNRKFDAGGDGACL